MSNLRLLVAACLLIASVAGCLSGSSDDSGSGDAGTPASGGDAGSNVTGNSTPTAPTLTVVVTLNGTAANMTNGSYIVPLGENVTFDASNSTGDNLTFQWEFGAGNESSGAVVTHAFDALGNVTVNVTATAADGAIAGASLSLVVADGAGGSDGAVIRTDSKTFDGTFVVGYQVATACTAVENSNVDFKEFTWTFVDQEEDGSASHVNHTVLTLSATSTHGGQNGIDLDLFLLDPDGNTLGSSAGPTEDESIELMQDLPAGDYTVRVEVCSGVNVSFSVAASAAYVRG